jgi:hypothetical protein
MNSGIGTFGPYNNANATIGRAYSMGSANLQGGSVPGETYMGSQGNSYSYSAAFAENEERSPWTPFHVQHGFEPTDSTVSLFLGGWYTQFGTIRDDTWQERFRGQLAACDPFIGPIVALTPLAATKLVEYGSRHAREARRVAGRELRCVRRASVGTTSGCRRSCARGRS